MSNKVYDQSIEWLFDQFPSYQLVGSSAYKPGLDNVIALCAAFENPQKELQFVHIAGSNGKGSTSSILASYLTENGLKTGLFTSPHLLDFRERIRINGELISKKEVSDFCTSIKNLNLDFSPSFFEITFVMALCFFRKKKAEICVIETGLGGRLDATNVITPLVSVITTISLEHTNFLGNTLGEIALEKGGIIKKNVPVVIGQKSNATEQVFRNKAQQESTRIYFADDFEILYPLDFPLLGAYQRKNFATAMATVRLLANNFNLSEKKMTEALKNLTRNTGFQGRLQVVEENPRVIFDVSHNLEGIEATLHYFQKEETELLIIYGTSADKDIEAIFKLFPKQHTYFFTEFSNNRSAKIEHLRLEAENQKLNSFFFSDPIVALNEAKKLFSNTETILVFGSFFLLSDFLK